MQIGPEHPLIFMHIPKTAGMSLFTAFCQHFGMDIADLYNISDHESAKAAPYIEYPKYCVYCGHFPFGLHEFLDRPTSYLAIVRHPLKRLISLYYYILLYRGRIEKKKAQRGLSVRQLFKAGAIPDYYVDFIPWLEGSRSPDLFFSCRAAELDNGMVRRFSGIGLDGDFCPDDALDIAKDNIQKYFTLVGVQESFSETINLIRTTFGLSKVEEYLENTNPSKKNIKEQIPAQVLKKLEEINRLDLELYSWIVERFKKYKGKNPELVTVQGLGRTDFENLKLWRAVGVSPNRAKAMRGEWLPKKKKSLEQEKNTVSTEQVTVRFNFD